MNPNTLEAVKKHGNQLLALFPHATIREPVALCRALRKLEGAAAMKALRACNKGPLVSDKEKASILDRVDQVLQFRRTRVPVMFNTDPRGYALKIDEDWMRQRQCGLDAPLQSDWGGYGIIAPELSGGSNGSL